jgi:hypothetical protein
MNKLILIYGAGVWCAGWILTAWRACGRTIDEQINIDPTVQVCGVRGGV